MLTQLINNPEKHQWFRTTENWFSIWKLWIFSNFRWFGQISYTTSMTYPSLLRVSRAWWRPDSCVSGIVDMVRKKTYQKILIFKKVTAVYIFAFFWSYEIWHLVWSDFSASWGNSNVVVKSMVTSYTSKKWNYFLTLEIKTSKLLKNARNQVFRILLEE